MDYSIRLTVQNDIQIGGKRVGDYIYNETEQSLSFSLPYPFPCKFKVINLEHIIVTPMMLNLPSFLKYHNIQFLRQQLMQVYCVSMGYLLLHASAWSENNRGYLAVGFPNCGKTYAVMRAVSNGADFCSDENVIYRDRIAYPVKRRTSLSPWVAERVGYPLTKKQRWEFFCAKIRSAVFPIFEPNIWVDLPYPRRAIRVDEVLYLTDGKYKDIALLTENEFPFLTNPVLQTWSYATGWNLQEVHNKFMRLCETFNIDTERS